jgi:hypothetical protein
MFCISFPDALKEIGEMNPRILQEKVNACTHKFRNVEGCREIVEHTKRLMDSSSHSVHESADTVIIM